ncbi:acetyl-coenzyme a carboxylase carboxyl transferase subunit alpha chloroplastic [Phtheirospermum japonicum]|uniref:acetyl-CoA carboxytransferase n=1 Tax=Phtheirospermum japonicum TaxID=374723 RepID=A0A830CCQ3_9LAMI|nr:acetyl-coenzyme a carboxylase carboxyl transferase subunit alpha chloroplastic [Phtheirospermum japonicum]
MITLSLVSGNCGRIRGDKCKSTNEFLAGDHTLGKSLRNLNGVRSKDLEGSMKQGNVKKSRVVAGVRKGKKHDYPWPDDVDPNCIAPLTYLSNFKPLQEKPKPVTLAFEKPLVDLEQKIIEVQRMADDTGLDFTDQINALELKYQQALKDLYTHLSPIQRLSIARHPNRPTVLDHILNITEKALRMMKYADHHGFPIVTFVDTPGAFADLKSEELGQGEAIAQNLRTMFGLKVPIITIVTGEGGSGGALAIACANKLLMLENSAFYVASPEACASILWKSSQAAPKAAEKLRITAQEHYKLKIADGIIPEPIGGAHTDPVWTSLRIKDAIIQQMEVK